MMFSNITAQFRAAVNNLRGILAQQTPPPLSLLSFEPILSSFEPSGPSTTTASIFGNAASTALPKPLLPLRNGLLATTSHIKSVFSAAKRRLGWGVNTQHLQPQPSSSSSSPKLTKRRRRRIKDALDFASDYEGNVYHYRDGYSHDEETSFISDVLDRRMLFIAPPPEKDHQQDESGVRGWYNCLRRRFWPSAALLCRVDEEDTVDETANEWSVSRDEVLVVEDEDTIENGAVASRENDAVVASVEREEEWEAVDSLDKKNGDGNHGDGSVPIENGNTEDEEPTTEADMTASVVNTQDASIPEMTLLQFFGWEENMDLSTAVSSPQPAGPEFPEMTLLEFMGWDECRSETEEASEEAPQAATTESLTDSEKGCDEECDLWEEARVQSRLDVDDQPTALFQCRRREEHRGRKVYEQDLGAATGERWRKTDVFHGVMLAVT